MKMLKFYLQEIIADKRLMDLILFGSLCGVFLFILDCALIYYENLSFPFVYFIISLIIYFSLFCMMSIIFSFFIITLKPEQASQKETNLLIISVFVIFSSGVVTLNELILPGINFKSFLSLSLTSLWGLSCILLSQVINKISCRYSCKKYLVVKMSLCTILCLFWLLSSYHYFNREYSGQYLAVFELIILVAISFGVYLFVVIVYYLFFYKKLYILFVGVFCFIILVIFYFNDVRSTSRSAKNQHGSDHQKPNIVLLVLDTLRADHLGCYGYMKRTSPKIDEFADEGYIFKRCYSPANWTVPGHASIFTGKYPISHGARKVYQDILKTDLPITCARLSREETTLAEILANNGYKTGAIVSNIGFVSEVYGLDQGFIDWINDRAKYSMPNLYLVLRKFTDIDRYYPQPRPNYRRADDITRLSMDWIDNNSIEKPFFLFINYMDPHEPLLPPEPFKSKYSVISREYVLNLTNMKKLGKPLNEMEREYMKSRYDGEIAFLDNEIGSLFEHLKENEIYDNSLVIITSDHGEFLGEHGLIGHEISLYDPVLRVPLIIKTPSKYRMRLKNVFSTVSTIDILPTVLEIVDIEIPQGIHGESMVNKLKDRPIYIQHYADKHLHEWYDGRFSKDMIGIVTDEGMKLISGEDNREMYDLNEDPDEERNKVWIAPKIYKILKEKLDKWKRETPRRDIERSDLIILDGEIMEDKLNQLKDLGYIY